MQAEEHNQSSRNPKKRGRKSARRVPDTEEEEEEESSSSESEKSESLYNPDFGVGKRSVARKDWSALQYTDDYCLGLEYSKTSGSEGSCMDRER